MKEEVSRGFMNWRLRYPNNLSRLRSSTTSPEQRSLYLACLVMHARVNSTRQRGRQRCLYPKVATGFLLPLPMPLRLI